MAASHGTPDTATLLQRISNNTKQVEQGTKKVGGDKDTCDLRDELQRNSEALIADINDAKDQIQSLGSGDSVDKVMYNRLQKDFKTVTSKAEEVLKRYSELEHRYPTTGLMEKQMSLRRTTEEQQQQTQQQDQLGIDDVVAIEQRNERLASLRRDIAGLHDIQTNVALVVNEQGDQITAIEENVEQAGDNVRGGGRALAQGSILATKNRKLMLIIGLIIAGVVVFVVLFIMILSASLACQDGRCA